MYVLVHKQRVIVGPMAWNRAMFSGALNKLNITTVLPRKDPTDLPIVFDADTKLCSAVLEYPEHNPKIEYLHGPFWNFDEPTAVGTFQILETPIEFIKGNLKATVATERYNREIAGTTATIQNMAVTVDTNRGSRDIFVQQYLLMSENDVVNWKFPEAWLTLTKSDLGIAVAAGVAHVQAQFNWELEKNEEIDACTTAAELDAVVIVEVVENPILEI